MHVLHKKGRNFALYENLEQKKKGLISFNLIQLVTLLKKREISYNKFESGMEAIRKTIDSVGTFLR